MTWCAISDGRRALHVPPVAERDRLLARGALVLELPIDAADPVPRVLFELARTAPWAHRIALRQTTRETLVFEHLHGGEATFTTAGLPPAEEGATLRITLCWHGPEQIGMISVEELRSGACTLKIFEAPRPWSLKDAADLVQSRGKIDPNVTALAIADRGVPTGMVGGLVAGSLIDTPDGPRAVETLQPRDLVQTSDHGVQPIRQVVGYEAPCVGRFAPMRLKAPFFGLTRDLTVARDHRLLVTGADAEYLFGAEDVLIKAHHLGRLAELVPGPRPATTRYYHVLMDAHVCLSMGGGWAESLYVGDLADRPAHHATSILSGVPARALPRHTRVASPQLRKYEAAVLVSTLCA